MTDVMVMGGRGRGWDMLAPLTPPRMMRQCVKEPRKVEAGVIDHWLPHGGGGKYIICLIVHFLDFAP